MIGYRYNAHQALTKILTEIDDEVEENDSELLDCKSDDDSVEFADCSNANDNDNSDNEHDAALPSQTDVLRFATECLVDESADRSDAETEAYFIGAYDRSSDAEDLQKSEAVMTSKCGTIQWSSAPHRARRLSPWNIMSDQRGVPESVEFETISDSFCTFMEDKT